MCAFYSPTHLKSLNSFAVFSQLHIHRPATVKRKKKSTTPAAVVTFLSVKHHLYK